MNKNNIYTRYLSAINRSIYHISKKFIKNFLLIGIMTSLILSLTACVQRQYNGYNTRYGNNAYNSQYVQYGKTYTVLKSSHHYVEQGVASWYGRRFNKKRTSSGERYNMYQMTAAHKTLPLSSHVKVTNLENGRQVIVRVNDRGPFISNRLIDLSYAAAKKLGMLGRGVAPVKIIAI